MKEEMPDQHARCAYLTHWRCGPDHDQCKVGAWPACQMVHGACIHVPSRIHEIRGSEPVLLYHQSILFLVSFSIVPDVMEVVLKAAVTARCQVPLDALELELNPATRLAGEPLAPSRGRGGADGRDGGGRAGLAPRGATTMSSIG